MFEPIMGSRVREQVLLFLHMHGSGYAREISRFFDAPLDSVQKQLKRLESGGVLISESKGRTLIYRFDKGCIYLRELHALLDGVNRKANNSIEQIKASNICKQKTYKKNRVVVKLYTD